MSTVRVEVAVSPLKASDAPTVRHFYFASQQEGSRFISKMLKHHPELGTPGRTEVGVPPPGVDTITPDAAVAAMVG